MPTTVDAIRSVLVTLSTEHPQFAKEMRTLLASEEVLRLDITRSLLECLNSKTLSNELDYLNELPSSPKSGAKALDPNFFKPKPLSTEHSYWYRVRLKLLENPESNSPLWHKSHLLVFTLVKVYEAAHKAEIRFMKQPSSAPADTEDKNNKHEPPNDKCTIS